jgi:hypothetical protein
MGAAAESVSEVVDPISEVVGDVGDVIESAVSEVGHAVEEIGQAVGKTVEAIAKDPAKAIPLIAVAVVAPELAPLLWEGATVAEAAMVLNTGLQLAQGADPAAIAQNLAVSMATQGITSNLDVSTGNFMADKALGSAASAAIQGGNVNQAIGSSLGNSIIGAGTGAMASEIRNFDYKGMYDQAVRDNGLAAEDAKQLVQGRIFQDGVNAGVEANKAADLAKNFDPNAEQYTAYKDAAASKDEILNSKIFKDAIDAGFTQEEAAAIAKGTIEGQDPKVSNPIAGANVTVEGAPASDATGTTSPITYASISKEDLDKELGDGEIDQATYDALLPHASELTKAEQPYVDPLKESSPIDATGGEPTGPSVTEEPSTPQEPSTPPTNNFSGVLGTTTDANGHVISTFDDGSTLTYDPENGEVVDFTEATDYEDPSAGGTKGGLSLRLGKGATQTRAIRGTTGKTSSGTTPSGATDTSGLSGLGTSYGSNLTQSTSSGNPEYSLFGEIAPQEGMASGGAVQHMATGSTPDTSGQGVYDLSTTAASPFLGGGNQSIMALKPQIIKGKINYALPGYPFGQEWKLAAEGGAIQNAPEGHNPEFFSEGGLNSLQHTYLKGGGDGTSDSIPAMLANGEFVIPADVVSSLGNGSSDSGAKVLDEFLKTIRAHKRKADPKKLPPDSKGVKGYLLEAKKKVKK